MSRVRRIAPVQTVLEQTERRLAEAFAASERRVAEGEAKLEELERYRAEYERAFAERAARGMGATDLRDYQAFLARLKEAIRQQRSVVERARIDRDVEQRRWRQAAQKAKALDHVVEAWRAEERRAGERREQREIDERAQRKVNIP
jgi:flagellar FliJ protein